MMTDIAPRHRRPRRLLMAAWMMLAMVLSLEALAPQQTDAAWISEETGTVSASAGTVEAPVTTCQGRNSAPNLLHLDPSPEGLPVTGYLVTISVDGDVPGGWDTGTTSEGYSTVPANTPTYVPASTSTVAWGITGEWNRTWNGTVSVEALGPGGWASTSVTHEWSVGFDFFGAGYGTCS